MSGLSRGGANTFHKLAKIYRVKPIPSILWPNLQEGCPYLPYVGQIYKVKPIPSICWPNLQGEANTFHIVAKSVGGMPIPSLC